MLMCSNYAKKIINFDVKVDETVRYQCRNSDLSKVSDKEIFKIDKSYYFYLYNRNVSFLYNNQRFSESAASSSIVSFSALTFTSRPLFERASAT